MLRPYPFKHHKIHKVQSFVNYLFLEIICKAPKLKGKHKKFSSAMVIPKYRHLLGSGKTKDSSLLKQLKSIYAICKDLPSGDIKTIKRAVLVNNRIRELCNGKHQPVHYTDIDNIHKDLSQNIKSLCKFLYGEAFKLESFQSFFGDIGEYYKFSADDAFMCHCCGMRPIMNKYHSYRSAFDHYLPQGKYPFVAVNFNNLMPICDTCNNKYKLEKDTLYLEHKEKGKTIPYKRTKAFYPYRKNIPDIRILFNFKNPYNGSMVPDDFELDIRCDTHQEETNNWMRIFGIEETYKAYYCSRGSGKTMFGYLEEQYTAYMNYKILYDTYMDLMKNNKYGDCNFLKIPFLECLEILKPKPAK